MTSPVREAIVRLLGEHPDGVPQSRIHRILGVSKSWVSEVLSELERSGIATRIRLGNQYIVKLRAPSQRSADRTLRLGLVWSTEYVFIAPFAKSVRRELGLEVRVVTYPSALAATWALVSGDVDLALTPLVTQAYAYALTKSLRIIGGGAYGGALIMYKPGALKDVVASSELSTMDLCRFLAVREGLIRPSTTRYFSKPSEVSSLAAREDIKYVVTWHPLTEELFRIGFKAVASCDDLELSHCCTLAATARLGNDLQRAISRIYVRALESFSSDPSRWVEWYSARVGIDPSTVSRGIRYYKLNPYVSREDVVRLTSKIGIPLPDTSSLVEAVQVAD